MADIQTGIVMRSNYSMSWHYMYYLFIYMNTRQKYHKLIDKTNKLWIKTNLYTDKLLFK